MGRLRVCRESCSIDGHGVDEGQGLRLGIFMTNREQLIVEERGVDDWSTKLDLLDGAEDLLSDPLRFDLDHHAGAS